MNEDNKSINDTTSSARFVAERCSSNFSKDNDWNSEEEIRKEMESEINISVPKRFGLYESEVIFSKNDVVLSKHSFTFNYDQQLKKVYAFHSVEFHKTLGGLQGETMVGAMKPQVGTSAKVEITEDTAPLGQVKRPTGSATKAAPTSPDSVNPIVSATISQLERKVEKTYEELVEALLNPRSSM
ncbi:uncharacterized protein LOC123301700 [Chrysoperla carnea]|uniref:uncharacterized protein LOC123301700 n=1 Tax=Chrysoperla carnea TaxID=189513 RepID=UPI001D0748D6|nr:uncharacterized protein LOC123301700 [Chrysoperla carnea]